MPAERFLWSPSLVLLILGFVVVAAAAAWWVSLIEGGASSYSRRGVPVDLPGEGPSFEEWATLPPERQEAWDNAALDRVEQAEIDAAADARDAAGFLAEQLRINSTYRP